MAREVREGFARRPRSIPPKYFYDDVGSQLFDAICQLPEYYLTRAERALLVRHADVIVRESQAGVLVEIGSGMARKTGALLASMCARSISPTYVPFDIAPEPIQQSARALLEDHPQLRVRGVVGDFAHDCARLALAAPPFAGPRLFAFLGSTIGNLDEDEAPAMLERVAQLMTERDRFLLGVDLVKDARVLHAAYNDSRGLTARFNKNVLSVLARELEGDVDLRGFEHCALYDEAKQRIEMRLVSTRAQVLTFRSADVRADLARGEHVLTEISRKFTRESVEQLLVAGGMRLDSFLSDGQFALCVARASNLS